MHEYLMKRKAKLQEKLTEMEKQVRSADLSDDEVEKISDAVDTIKSELTEINTALDAKNDSDNDTPDDKKDDVEDDKTDDTSDDATNEEKRDSNDKEETRDKIINLETRSKLQSAIKEGLTLSKKDNEKRYEKRTRELFSRLTLGQSVNQNEVRSLGIDLANGNGKVTVPKVVAKEVLTYAQENNPLRQFGTVHQDSSTQGYPVLTAAPTANGHNKEYTLSDSIPETSMKLDEVELTPTEFDALITFSKKLSYRSGISIENEVIKELSKAYTAKEAAYMFNGTDTGNINAGSLVKKAVAWKPASAVDLTKGDAVYNMLINFKNSVKKEVRKGSMFMLNTAAETLIETMTDGEGRPLYRPMEAVENGSLGIDGRLIGFNAHVTDYLTADAKADDSVPAIFFGDFSTFHIQDVIGSMQVQVLNELYSRSNLIGVQLYNILDGQLVYSPLQPTVFRLDLSANSGNSGKP